MRRLVLCLVLIVGAMLSRAAFAQDPQVTVSAEQEEVVVGQPYILRIEVLVPTFMPRAPVFPTFEMPGLIVRLPEKSTGPTSKRVDGETWSGVRRTYRIYPTRAGVTEIAAQQVSIVYKDPETNEDVQISVEVPPTQIRATVPPGARSLDPLIIAQDVRIEQTWDVQDGGLAVGSAVVRSLDISVDGTSALFVPPLLDNAVPIADTASAAGTENEGAAPPFLAYPEDAIVAEKLERGVMSGSRHEQVSYIAQSGGAAEFPEIKVRWYSLASGSIEDIVLDGKTVTVTAPPVERKPPDIATILRGLVVLLALAGVVWGLYRFALPRLVVGYRVLRLRYDATTRAAHNAAVRQAKARDLSALLVALDERTQRGCPPGMTLSRAIADLTKAIYRDGSGAGADNAALWRAIERALRAERPGLFGGNVPSESAALPVLNPFTDPAPHAIYFNSRS